MLWMPLLLAVSAALNLYCAWRNLQGARMNLENAERNERLAHRLTHGDTIQSECATGTSMHPLLCKWWMRTRAIQAEITSEGIGGAAELYCPLWAKPLDWLHAALFGGSKFKAA